MSTNNGQGSDRILVTGGCGYLGSQLIRDLGDPDSPGTPTVRILDNFQRETQASLLNLPGGARYELVEGDILDPSAVQQALEDIDTVVHLAALVSTPFSHEHPEWTEHVNHWGTVRLLQDCEAADVDCFVFASSASVLGPGGPFDEESNPEPMNSYTRSKLEAERAIQSANGDIEATIFRFGTIYGGRCPGLRFDAVPNRLVYRAATGQTVKLGAPRAQVWPYLHVEDASAAIRQALFDGPLDDLLYNAVGTNADLETVADYVEEALPEARIRYGDSVSSSTFSSEVLSDRLKAEGWTPSWTLKDGVESLADRFGSFHPHAPAPGTTMP